MSFTDEQVGLEDYAETIQLLFPHPPVILDRHMEQQLATSIGRSLVGTAAVVQWLNSQHPRTWHLLLRALSESEMATLQTLRNTTGILRLKVAAGVATTYLVAFAPEDDQHTKAMVADHPETKTDGSAIDDIFKVYEAELRLVRME